MKRLVRSCLLCVLVIAGISRAQQPSRILLKDETLKKGLVLEITKEGIKAYLDEEIQVLVGQSGY